MSHLRVLICRVDESSDVEQMTELACIDLPPALPSSREDQLDRLEAAVAEPGHQILRRLCELQWEALDAQAVARYRRCHTPGTVVADGHKVLQVASRFGTLHLRRQICVYTPTNAHELPGNTLLPIHRGMLITRGLEEWACLLPQELPFASVARLLGWQTGEPGVLSATQVRSLVRDHGERIRRLERTDVPLHHFIPLGTRRLQGVPHTQPRPRAGWPMALNAAVASALRREQARPPEGVSRADWERVLAARRVEGELDLSTLRGLGPTIAPGQVLLTLDEVLTPAREPGRFHELRTACLCTTECRRYLSGTGQTFLHQVLVAVQHCAASSLLVIADGARWIRAFFRDYLAQVPQARLLLDWYHLAQKCRDMAGRCCRSRADKAHLLRRLYRRLWVGEVPRAIRLLQAYRPLTRNHEALEEWCRYLAARAEWIPNYRARRRNRQYIGSGQVEKANDRIVARRQKGRGMQWSIWTSDALAALRTLQLNDGWHTYWVRRCAFPLTIPA